MEPSKRFSESQRKEVYSQAFNNMFYGYGDRHFEHCWALFGRDNDDICWSYFKKKNKKWDQFISLGRKYIPKRIMPEEAYKKEGLRYEEPIQPNINPKDYEFWTEEEKKEEDEYLDKKING